MKKYRLKQHITETANKETSSYYTIQARFLLLFWKNPEYKTYVWNGSCKSTIDIIEYNHDTFKTIEEAQDFINNRLLKDNVIHYRDEKIEMVHHYNKNTDKVVYVWDRSNFFINYIEWNYDLDCLKLSIDTEKDKEIIKYKTKIVKI